MTAETARSGRSGAREGRTRTFDRTGNVARTVRPKLGPQTMIRMESGDRISGRPDQEEQEYLAAGVGAQLRALRKERGLSLRDVERRSGVNRSMISRLERGLRRPRASTLGWLSWGIAGPDGAEGVKAGLCAAAGDSLVAESRWSERSHARRAWRRLQEGGMELPGWLLAPYAVSIVGAVAPGHLGEARRAQDMARAGNVPWPDHMTGSVEALRLGGELDRATPYELARIGHAMLAEAKAARRRAARKRRREYRARLGLAGTDTRRPVRVPSGIPPEERALYRDLIALNRSLSIAARLR